MVNPRVKPAEPSSRLLILAGIWRRL